MGNPCCSCKLTRVRPSSRWPPGRPRQPPAPPAAGRRPRKGSPRRDTRRPRGSDRDRCSARTKSRRGRRRFHLPARTRRRGRRRFHLPARRRPPPGGRPRPLHGRRRCSRAAGRRTPTCTGMPSSSRHLVRAHPQSPLERHRVEQESLPFPEVLLPFNTIEPLKPSRHVWFHGCFCFRHLVPRFQLTQSPLSPWHCAVVSLPFTAFRRGTAVADDTPFAPELHMFLRAFFQKSRC